MEPESENSEPLRKLMREWSVDSPLPPRFQENVWRRIERAEMAAPAPAKKASLWAMFLAAVSAALPRPAMAVAYVAVLLFVGAGAGMWQARSQASRVESELGARYVQSVDPYQKPPGI